MGAAVARRWLGGRRAGMGWIGWVMPGGGWSCFRGWSFGWTRVRALRCEVWRSGYGSTAARAVESSWRTRGITARRRSEASMTIAAPKAERGGARCSHSTALALLGGYALVAREHDAVL